MERGASKPTPFTLRMWRMRWCVPCRYSCRHVIRAGSKASTRVSTRYRRAGVGPWAVTSLAVENRAHVRHSGQRPGMPGHHIGLHGNCRVSGKCVRHSSTGTVLQVRALQGITAFPLTAQCTPPVGRLRQRPGALHRWNRLARSTSGARGARRRPADGLRPRNGLRLRRNGSRLRPRRSRGRAWGALHSR